MANSNFSSLFNMTNSVQEPQNFRNSDEYKPSFKEGKGGVYQSIIRFIPWFANPEKSIIQKTVSYVKNPITKQGIYVDDPRSVGQPSSIIDMFFKFYNSGNAQMVDFGKEHLSSKPQYISLVQIIQDEQHPDLVGQIRVLKFGKKMGDELYAEEHPAVGQGTVPFHPIYGRYFLLKIVGQSGFNNYDQSCFFDMKNNNQTQPMGMWYINPATGQYEVVTESTDQQAVFNYLQTASPDLAKYDYQPWTAEQEKFINDALAIDANYLQTGTLSNNLAAVNTPSSGIAVNPAPVFPGATVPAPVAPAGIPTPAPAPAAPVGIPPVAPAVAPTLAPGIPQPAAPAAPAMGAFSMGQSNLGGAPVPGPAPAPSISGITIPSVEPATAPSGGVANLGGAIGNVDDVLSQL